MCIYVNLEFACLSFHNAHITYICCLNFVSVLKITCQRFLVRVTSFKEGLKIRIEKKKKEKNRRNLRERKKKTENNKKGKKRMRKRKKERKKDRE